ncbi:acylphosphatase [Aurantivibrio plasticivorans]
MQDQKCVSAKALVEGRVQGVGFRNFVRNHAIELGVSGYAKNLSDGGVEVLMQGPSDALQKLKSRLSSGPPGSFVEHLEWQVVECGPLDGFKTG